MNDSDTSAPTVFVVDDDASVRRSLGRTLRTAGYRVALFASPSEFLAAADRRAPGCLVLDVRLPGLNGLELQERLTAEGLSVPIVFITGHGDVPTTVRAMKGGATDFLPKPFGAAVLLASVREALAKDAATRQDRDECQELRARAASLSAREREVLCGVVSGKLNKQIAAKLGITVRTVKAHRHCVMAKLGIASVAELVRSTDRIAISAHRRP